jgi:hypothetical protein
MLTLSKMHSSACGGLLSRGANPAQLWLVKRFAKHKCMRSARSLKQTTPGSMSSASSEFREAVQMTYTGVAR